jgi:hypothetical protein
MSQLSRLLFVALAFVTFSTGSSFAGQAADCRQSSMVQLKNLAPEGFAVYTAISDKKFFLHWITCDDVPLGLSTAVHESVHHLTEDHDAFPLINHEYVRRPHEVSKFFAPSAIAKKFDRGDGYVTTYLKVGGASAATDFLYLLDELNAYTHDLNAAVALSGLRPANEHVDHRDGLAALMAFVAIYVQAAEEGQPATWSGLQKPEVAKTVSTLWGQAETVMASSCRVPEFGTNDQRFIRQFCGEKAQASLQKILGRAPVCPVDCLQSSPKSAAARQ